MSEASVDTQPEGLPPKDADDPFDVASGNLEPNLPPAQQLTPEQVEEITHILRAGGRLPAYLFPHLFETPREYELAYRGKMRQADVLAETMAVPLQPVKTFGTPTPDGWTNMLVLGDNLQVLRRLLQMKHAGQLRNPDGSDGVRLCYIDPPFASQREFTGTRSERAYADRVSGAEFVEHLRRRLILIAELLTTDGTLFVHLDTRKVHYVKVVLDELLGEGHFRNEIIWKRTSAHSGAHGFGPVHETILFYARSDDYPWTTQYEGYDPTYLAAFYTHVDPDGERWRRSDLTAAGIRHGETGLPWRGIDITARGRHWAYPPSELDRLDATRPSSIHWPRKQGGMPMLKRYYTKQLGVPLQDVWLDIKPPHNLAEERTGYPTQKPIALLQRIIESTTHPGDIVLDAFVGSATTAVAAQALPQPRRWIGIDSSKFAIYISQARLLRLAGKTPPQQAFTIYNAGLYDYKSLRDLSWPAYLAFVLQLFQCRPVSHTVGGVVFQGFLRDDPVLVYNFKDHPAATIGRSFVQDLAALCGTRLGSRCFIIAPAITVEPYEDYIDLAGIRFFFLRIPYSVIAELHKRAFTQLSQPTSEAKANIPIDSVGFDFIQPPSVRCRYLKRGGQLEVEILHFQSESFTSTPKATPVTDLAMIMVDCDYDGDVFALNQVYFAEDLERDNWHFRLPNVPLGPRVMLIYVDAYGNEYREVKAEADFVPTRASRSSRRPASE